ncbi:MAG: hypothetical protein GF398_10735 [Chitinivibrionales bacterium]|nr:hypothetical protein [Chitinivibrionales bacterium]
MHNHVFYITAIKDHTGVSMSLKVTFVLILCLTSVFAQELTQAEIDELKKQAQNDSAISQKAKKAISEDPTLIDRVPREKRKEFIRALKESESGGGREDTLKKKKGSNYPETETDTLVDTDDTTRIVKKDSVYKFNVKKMLEGKRNIPYDSIYGRALFGKLFQPVTISETPDDYKIMPGDEILLRFWGRYNLDKKYSIGNDGYVYVDPLKKQMYLLGMSYRRLKALIRKTTEDMTGVEGEARIISTRTIKVHIAGEAKNPGTISVPPFYTFWQALMVTGGADKLGSVRNIKLLRKGKVISSLDIYEYIRTGKEPKSALRDNDVILFERIEKIVAIGEAARRPGWYELIANETLSDLVAFAGGFSSLEYAPTVYIDRVVPAQRRKQDTGNRTVLVVDLSSPKWEKTNLLDGDIIHTQEKEIEYRNDVTITGRGIQVPGTYAIKSTGWTLQNLAEQAGGLKPGYHKFAELQRQTDYGSRSYHIDLSQKGFLSSFIVQAGDTIRTFHEKQFRDITMVKSSGYVRQQIEVPCADSLSLLTLLKRSKGTRDGALDYVYIKKVDTFGTVSYQKHSIADTTYAAKVMLSGRDDVIAFDYRDFNYQLPVVVLAFNKDPRIIEYAENLTLEIVIHHLKGLDKLVDSARVEIVIPDFESANELATTLTYSIAENTINDATLIEPGSVIIFRKDPRKSVAEYITFAGEVVLPGSYALESTRDRLMAMLAKAGGLNSRANPYSIRIERNGHRKSIPVEIKSLEPITFKTNWILNQGDKIIVGRDDYNVEITGAVFDPGVVAFNKDYCWKGYIDEGAGGALDTADLKKTYIQYPNGMTRRAKKGWFCARRVVSGAKIVVPFKPYKEPEPGPKEPFDYAKLIGVISTAATTLLTVIIAWETVR